MDRIVITGVGPVSAVGVGLDAFVAGLGSGRCGAAPVSRFDAGRCVRRDAAEVRGFSVEPFLRSRKSYLDRSSEFGFAATELALRDAGLDPASAGPGRIGLAFGTHAGCLDTMALFFADLVRKGPRLVKPFLFPHTYANTTASLLAIEYGLSGFHVNVSSGFVSAAAAVALAFDAVRAGRADAVIAGGTEALGEALFAGCDCLAADAGGFVPGEGGAMLVLESGAFARGRGARVRAEVAGAGMTSDDGSFAGTAPARAMREALCMAGAAACDVGCVVCAANGSPATDARESAAIAALFGAGSNAVPTVRPKRCLGETMGAGGALQIAAAVAVLEFGLAPAPRQPPSGGAAGAVRTVMANAMDPGGACVSVLLRGAADARS